MGQGGSREMREEEDIQSGVIITEGLMQQLQGLRPPRQPSKSSPLPSSSNSANANAVAAAMVRQNQRLGRALQGSQRIGDLLLKTEDEELGRIQQLADELIEREYQSPSKDPPCGPQADACLGCYKDHGDDPSACADAANAYIQCAKQTWAEVISAQ